ncbi:MAG: hypothetical protein GY796_26715 [Chloroflexi bacterium]|nr:hypothetical protein [Chloroflexota bacterium]
MITISGKAQLTFMLPTDVETAFQFYQDVNRILPYLPRIQFIESHGDQHLRICYVSRELNAYDVKIYCDVQALADHSNYSLRLVPKEAAPEIKAKSGFNKTLAYGRYSSASIFYPNGNQTRLDYQIHLFAELPKPWAIKFVPDAVMDGIANSITNHRIKEIAHGFIQQSLGDLAAWKPE